MSRKTPLGAHMGPLTPGLVSEKSNGPTPWKLLDKDTNGQTYIYRALFGPRSNNNGVNGAGGSTEGPLSSRCPVEGWYRNGWHSTTYQNEVEQGWKQLSCNAILRVNRSSVPSKGHKMFRVWQGIKTFQSAERGISDEETKIQINQWLVSGIWTN